MEIRQAIQKVIDEPAYRENAIGLSAQILKDAQNATGVQALEQLASSRR